MIDSLNLLLKVEKFFPPNSLRTFSTLILFRLAYIDNKFAASCLFLSPSTSEGMEAVSVFNYQENFERPIMS